ncbi:TauD/TfdA family dioxygenase [Curtobacterium herbarum]|uniref:TauD/TfdA-like domain-containing protein n=2 Tax=Curtobacterium herbarum TaxID=150122 RepID=A0ABP4K2W5_9MICO|nr:TauD/TfdA family dioxygenase [Curtobacterium herbarum]MCS6544958.1 TauD/TfdA family dioxygenase [Curtobacterium herbarum]
MDNSELLIGMQRTGYATCSVESAEDFYETMHEVAATTNLKAIPHPRRPNQETSLAPQTRVAMDPHSELGRTPYRCAIVGFLGVQPSQSGGETILVDTSLGSPCGDQLAELLPETLRFRGLISQAALPDGFDSATSQATAYGKVASVTPRDGDVLEFEYEIPTVVRSAISPAVLSVATSVVGPYGGAHDASSGFPISEETIERARQIMGVYSVKLRLDAGDVVLIDNCRTLHGRRAYAGDRVIVSALLSQFGSAFG